MRLEQLSSIGDNRKIGSYAMRLMSKTVPKKAHSAFTSRTSKFRPMPRSDAPNASADIVSKSIYRLLPPISLILTLAHVNVRHD
jgi:hypothetical protein